MSEIKPETIIKYSSYTPAQAKATRKYRESHKELVNEQRRKYYLERKERDPQFVEYKRIKAREYYARKMALKNAVVPDATPDVIVPVDIAPEPVVDVKVESVILSPPVVELVDKPVDKPVKTKRVKKVPVPV